MFSQASPVTFPGKQSWTLRKKVELWKTQKDI